MRLRSGSDYSEPNMTNDNRARRNDQRSPPGASNHDNHTARVNTLVTQVENIQDEAITRAQQITDMQDAIGNTQSVVHNVQGRMETIEEKLDALLLQQTNTQAQGGRVGPEYPDNQQREREMNAAPVATRADSGQSMRVRVAEVNNTRNRQQEAESAPPEHQLLQNWVRQGAYENRRPTLMNVPPPPMPTGYPATETWGNQQYCAQPQPGMQVQYGQVATERRNSYDQVTEPFQGQPVGVQTDTTPKSKLERLAIELFGDNLQLNNLGNSLQLTKKIDMFDVSNVESFQAWVSKFDLAMLISGYNSKHKCLVLSCFLKGKALAVYHTLPQDVLTVYPVLIESLTSRLSPKMTTTSSWLSALNVAQGERESITDYFHRLISETQGHHEDPNSEVMLTVTFQRGLRPEIRDLIMEGPDSSFNNILAKAKEIETRLNNKKIWQSQGAHGQSNWQSWAQPRYQQWNRPAQQQQYGRTQQPQYTQMSTNRFTGPPSNTYRAQTNTQQSNNNNSGPPTQPFSGTCNRCGQRGHRERECGNKQVRRPQSAINEVCLEIQESTPNRDDSPSELAHGECQEAPFTEFTDEQIDPNENYYIPQCNRVALPPNEKTATNTSNPIIFYAPRFTPKLNGVRMTGKLDSGSDASIITRDLITKLENETQKKIMVYPFNNTPVDYNGNKLGIRERTILKVEDGPYCKDVDFLIDDDKSDKLLFGARLMHDLCGEMMNKLPFSIDFSQPNIKPKVTVQQIIRNAEHRRAVARCRVSNLNPPPKDNGSESEEFALCFCSTNNLLPSALVTQQQEEFDIPITDFQSSYMLSVGTEVGEVRYTQLPRGWSCLADDELTDSSTNTQEYSGPYDPKRIAALRQTLEKNVQEISGEEKEQLIESLLNRAEQFAFSDAELGTCMVLQHHIDIDGAPPFRDPSRRYSANQQQFIVKKVQEWLQAGVIERSTSPFCSQLLLVPKPGAKEDEDQWRLCIDLRTLNKLTVQDATPIIPCRMVIAKLGTVRAKYFSKIDLKSGYLQLLLTQASRPLTAFQTPSGLFQFTRICFGLTTATQSFTRAMTIILDKYTLDDRVQFYVDDVIIATKSKEEMHELLADILDTLAKADIKIGPSKCTFFASEIPFLGQIISRDGVKADPAKIKAIQEFPLPQTIRQLQSFMGTVNFLRVSTPQLSEAAAPLYAMTKLKTAQGNTKLLWDNEKLQAFNTVKSIVTSAPTLILPDPSKPFVIECDASLFGLGAVLLQVHDDGYLHPIAYAGRTLNQAQQNYCATLRECLAAAWSLRHFTEYIAGHKVYLYTDHSALLALRSKKDLPDMLARWALIIDQYRPDIRHRAGRLNLIADMLSRKDEPMNPRRSVKRHLEQLTSLHKRYEELRVKGDMPLGTINEIMGAGVNEVRTAQMAEPKWAALIDYLERQELPADTKLAHTTAHSASAFEIVQGVLHRAPERGFDSRVVIPRSMQTNLLHEFHALPTSGHLRQQKTYERVRERYWWPGLLADVQYSTNQCRLCATRSGTGRKQKPYLQCVQMAKYPMERVGMDLCQYPLASSGAKYMYVLIDYHTKYVDTFALNDKTAATVAAAFVRFCSRFGPPEQVVCDNGTEFVNELAKQVNKILKVKQTRTTTYYPQADGECERMHREFQKMLSKFTATTGADWDKYMPLATFAYNTAQHSSTGFSPFQAMFGRLPNLPSEQAVAELVPERFSLMSDSVDYPSMIALHLKDIWEQIGENILKAQEQYKQQHDKHCRQNTIQTGDKVMCFRPQLLSGELRKLARPFHGPFVVQKVTNTNAVIVPADKPDSPPETVHLTKLTKAPEEIRNEAWLGSNKKCDRVEPLPRPREQETIKTIATLVEVTTTVTGPKQRPAKWAPKKFSKNTHPPKRDDRPRCNFCHRKGHEEQHCRHKIRIDTKNTGSTSVSKGNDDEEHNVPKSQDRSPLIREDTTKPVPQPNKSLINF